MRKILFALFLVLPFSFAFAQVEKPEISQSKSDSANFTAREVKEMAVFPGCESETEKTALVRCFQQRISELLIGKLWDFSEEMERLNKEEAIARIQFVVDKNGKLIQIKALEGGMPELAAASSKAIEEIAAEIQPIRPATLEDGSPVNLVFQLPVKYRIELNETTDEPDEPEYEWDEVVLATLTDGEIRYEIRASKLHNFSVYEVRPNPSIFLGNFATMDEIAITEPYRSIFQNNKKILITEGMKDEILYTFYNKEEDPSNVYIYQLKEGEEVLLEKMSYYDFYMSSKYSEFFLR
ncbi:MAG: hypothetical protein GX159_09440 [Flavobacteriaceae bacterium]|jgi:hypothetical protein|nr:hypothetical protein [Flavobacteriaceae bacterium]